VQLLVRRYLAGFGPASRKDIANFSGLPPSEIADAIERFPTRRFRGTETGEELIDLPRAPLPHPDAPAAPRFLPTWDATLLVDARRTQILPEEYRPVIFTSKNPQSVSTFLVDGRVAGTWRFDGGRVQLEPFEPLTLSARRALQDEARGLEDLHA
jgi:Winged helix DNA-binding domain